MRPRSGSARERGCASAFLVHVHRRHTLLDRLGFSLSDVATRKAFVTVAIVPLGYTAVMEGGGGVGIGIGEPILWIAPAEQTSAPMRIACHAADGAVVDAFYSASPAAGDKDNGAPGLRPRYHANYCASLEIGPNGHNLEVVCHRTV